MRVAVLGAGSIGLHLAAQLHLASHHVDLVCRSKEQMKAIKEQGIHYTRLDGSVEQLFVNVQTIEDSSEGVDWIFLTVKQTQVLSTIPLLKKINPKVPVLCFQNGLGHEDLLKTYLPSLSIFYAITTEGAYRKSQRSVQHTGKGQTYIGTLNPNQTDERVMLELADSLRNSSLKVQVEKNMKERIWKKLIINSCINPLTAVLHVTNGSLLESEYAMTTMNSLFEEAIRLAQKEGIAIETGFWEEIVQVCRNTYHNKSSMLQDIEAGRETEIKFINGALLRAAKRFGISVPVHTVMVNLMLAKQQF